MGRLLINPARPLKERFRALFTLKNIGGPLALDWIIKVGGVADPNPDPSDPYVGGLDPDPDPLVRGMDPDPDPSITKQKKVRKTFITTALRLLFDFLSLRNYKCKCTFKK